MCNKLLLVLLMVLSVSVAEANCVYNGAPYPEGTLIGPYICNGSQWVRR